MEKHCEGIYCDPRQFNSSILFNNKDQGHYHSTIISCGKQNLFHDSLPPAPTLLSKTKKLVLSKKNGNNYSSSKINKNYSEIDFRNKSLVIIPKVQTNEWNFENLSGDEGFVSYHDYNRNCFSPSMQEYDSFHNNRRYSFVDLAPNDCYIESNKYSQRRYYSAQIEKCEKNKLQKMSTSLTDGSTNGLKASCSTINLSNGKNTLSKKALKIAQRAQKISIASISSELSSSASALYSLFTEPNGVNVNNNSYNQALLNNNNNSYFFNRNLSAMQYFMVC